MSLAQRYRRVGDERYYADDMSSVTDADEVAAEAAETDTTSACGFERADSVVDGDDEKEEDWKRRFRDTSVSESAVQQRSAPLTLLDECDYAEVLFDAEIPGMVETEERFCWDTRIARPRYDQVSVPYCAREEMVATELLPESEMEVVPVVAGDGAGNEVVEMLGKLALRPVQRTPDTEVEYGLRREGRQLTYTLLSAPETASGLQQQDYPAVKQLERRHEYAEPEQLECDWIPHVPGSQFLPGIEHLTNINVRSAFITYDRDVEALYDDSVSFLDDYYKDWYNCLNKNLDTLRLPGENFLLAENEAEFGLSLQRPTAQCVFDLIDQLVHADVLDQDGMAEEIPTTSWDEFDEFVDTEPEESGRDTRGMTAEELDRIFLDEYHAVYSSPSSTASEPFNSSDEDDVLEIGEMHLDTAYASHPSSLQHYMDTGTQQRIAYIALDQLLAVPSENEPDMHPAMVPRDIDGQDDLRSDAGFSSTSYLKSNPHYHATPLNIPRVSTRSSSPISASQQGRRPEISQCEDPLDGFHDSSCPTWQPRKRGTEIVAVQAQDVPVAPLSSLVVAEQHCGRVVGPADSISPEKEMLLRSAVQDESVAHTTPPPPPPSPLLSAVNHPDNNIKRLYSPSTSSSHHTRYDVPTSTSTSTSNDDWEKVIFANGIWHVPPDLSLPFCRPNPSAPPTPRRTSITYDESVPPATTTNTTDTTTTAVVAQSTAASSHLALPHPPCAACGAVHEGPDRRVQATLAVLLECIDGSDAGSVDLDRLAALCEQLHWAVRRVGLAERWPCGMAAVLQSLGVAVEMLVEYVLVLVLGLGQARG